MLDSPGIYGGGERPFCPAPLYHACTSRISRGQLWTLHSKSPAHLRQELDHPSPPSRAMRRGDALHTAILEPERFDREYAIPTELVLSVDRRTKNGKRIFDEFLEQAKTDGRIPLGWSPEERSFSKEDVRAVLDIASNLAATPELVQLFREGEGTTETTYCWDEEPSKFRVRLDRVNRTRRGPVIIDLKSAADARLESFRRSVVDYGLHFQAGMYCDGFRACTDEEPRTFIFFVYEMEPPYAHAFFRAAEDVIDAGRFEYRAAVARLRECQATGEWPGYDPAIQTLNLPPWYK